MARQTVLLDFDGVLHSYTSGWVGVTEIPDPPVAGAREFCDELVRLYDVIILSTRCSQEGGAKAIEGWLRKYDFSYQLIVSPDGKKPPAFLTIDDRVICFTGKFPTMEEIHHFQPWNKKKIP